MVDGSQARSTLAPLAAPTLGEYAYRALCQSKLERGARVGAEGLAPPIRHWLVTCSCGWERECSSEWAARSVSKLHPQLAPMDVVHVTVIEGPDGRAGGQQLTLT